VDTGPYIRPLEHLAHEGDTPLDSGPAPSYPFRFEKLSVSDLHHPSCDLIRDEND